MPLVVCPTCGEDEDLEVVDRDDTDSVQLRCAACGHRWAREAVPTCRICGSTDLRYTPKPLWEKGRGDQRTPAGRRDAYACWSCGGRDVTSANPTPAR